ncbi:hypothetical protein Pfo_017109 [Paulownia fortunei]|nr:hypothetical protein Pfo_017109 [Paulownia fortunei]
MATSQNHFRSISLPSRLHPTSPKNLETELQKLQSWEFSKTVPISSEVIQSGFLGLAEMYNSVEKLAQSPATQKSLILQHEQDEKPMEESLECSVELLDSCNTIRELLQMIKDQVQALQSALRRKGLDSSVQNDISSYLCFRQKMNKCISKTLKKLKNLEHKNGSNLSVDADSSFIVVLKGVTGVAIAIFRCILLFLSWPMAKPGSWSLVSKLMLTKTVAFGRENNVISEVGSVDFGLSSLQERIRKNCAKVLDVKMKQNGLQNLDATIQGLEVGLERSFRQLVQSRVTLLNLITDH